MGCYAVAWLLNDNGIFMKSRIMNTYLPGYDFKYEQPPIASVMRSVYYVERDELMRDLIGKLTGY